MSTALDRGAYDQTPKEDVDAAARRFSEQVTPRVLPERPAFNITSTESRLGGGGLSAPPGDAGAASPGESTLTETISGAVNGTPQVIDACVRGTWRNP